MLHILDNPIWHALSSLDSDKNIGRESIKYFDKEMAPFIGASSWDENSQKDILARVPTDRSWFLLIGEEVKFIDEIEIVFTIPLYQLCCNKLKPLDKDLMGIDLIPLNNHHIEEMVALTALTKPGPFLNRTIEFGNYHGIFRDGKLVAMGGERLHLEGFTEISAICTHPDYRGKGLGARITHFLAADVLQKGAVPFLHARIDNKSAIDLYQRLGFEIRKEIQFYIFRRKQQ